MFTWIVFLFCFGVSERHDSAMAEVIYCDSRKVINISVWKLAHAHYRFIWKCMLHHTNALPKSARLAAAIAQWEEKCMKNIVIAPTIKSAAPSDQLRRCERSAQRSANRGSVIKKKFALAANGHFPGPCLLHLLWLPQCTSPAKAVPRPPPRTVATPSLFASKKMD